MNILRRLLRLGCKIQLKCNCEKSSTVEISTPAHIKYSECWLITASDLVHAYLRQIKKTGDVSHDDVAKFIDGGSKFIDELSDDEWLVNYNIVSVN